MSLQVSENKGKKYVVLMVVCVMLIGSIGIARFLIKNRVTPDKVAVTETIVPVKVVPVAFESTQITIPAQGTVTSAVQISLRPEVSGKVIEVSPDLVPGGTFTKGDIMFKIDPRDYRVIVANQKQALAAAKLALKQEQARGRVAAREWKLLQDSMTNSEMDEELALRIPQMIQAQAAVDAAQQNLDKAYLDLNRCTVKAPFNGIILKENVDLGQLVGSNSEAAVFTGTDEYWVQVSIPVDTLRFIEFPTALNPGSQVTISQGTANGSVKRQGTIIRLLADMMESGRLARILVSIPEPTRRSSDAELPLLIGSYVNVEIMGTQLDHVVRIPRSVLHSTTKGSLIRDQQHDAVWIMDDDDRLAIQPVTVDWRTADEVFIHNSLKPGDRLILSTIDTPLEGMKLTEFRDIHSNGMKAWQNED